jgi:hypothetical protein
VDGQPVDGAAADLWVSITQLAALKGRSKQAISKRVLRLKESGAIEVREEDGTKKVNLVAYDRATKEHTDPAQALRNPGLDVAPQSGAEPLPSEAKPAADDKQEPKSKGYLLHKETSAAYQAENDRLDLEERLSRTCDKADVEHRTFNIFRRLRDSLMGLPAICASQVVHADNERAVRNILDEEVRKMLLKLAKDLDQADDAGDIADDDIESEVEEAAGAAEPQ